MNTTDDKYIGVVTNVISDTRKPYVVTQVEGVGIVTFSLSTDVWTEEDYPEKGHHVCLFKLTKKHNTWRAREARFMQPSDENEK